jgi:hypothetical protein
MYALIIKNVRFSGKTYTACLRMTSKRYLSLIILIA